MKRFLLVTMSAAALLLHGASPLFNGKKSDWKIIISPQAVSTELNAAREFQHFIFRISGAKLPIARSSKIPASNAVVIGTAKTFPALPAAVTKFPEGDKGKDSLRIKTLSGNLYLTGNVPRGALYAVYDFLKNTMGVRWFFAGKAGELVPKRTTFSLPDLDIYDAAKFKYRGFHVCGKHYDRDMESWMSRNKINLMSSDPIGKFKWRRQWNDNRIAKGFHMVFSTHNVAIYDKKVFAERPELFAEINGKRVSSQLCWSNPEVDKILIERFISYCDEYPAVEALGLSAADNMNYCRCAKCSKKPLHELWFELYNRIVDGVRKKHPHMQFNTLAYQSYNKVPKVSMDSSMFIKYCMYNRCYVHRHGQCAMNDKAMAEVKAWQKKLPVVIYGYEFDIFKPESSAPFYYMISDQLRHFHKNDLKGVITECLPIGWRRRGTAKDSIPAGNNYKLAYYLYASALWDPAVDPDAVIKDYSAAAYGPAAPFMAKYAMLMGKAWDSMKIHYSYFYNSAIAGSAHLLNAKLISEIDSLMLKAAAAVKTEKDPARRKQISANFNEEMRIYNNIKTMRNSYLASQNSRNVLVPRTGKALDFSSSATINKMVSRSGKPQPWSVKVNYDDKALYFDIDCKDNNMKALVARRDKRDTEVFNDDCIELFISVPNDTRGIYRHLVANTRGTKYDAIALGGFTFDTAWNPQWQATTVKHKDGWRMKMVIPFTSLDAAPPKPGDIWPFTIKRSCAGRKEHALSGFPDAVYHDQNAFAMLQFAETAVATGLYALWYKQPEIDVMKNLLEKSGFQTVASRDLKTIQGFPMDREIYIFKMSRYSNFSVSYFQKKVFPALKNGALVIFFAWGERFAPEKYFNDPKLKLTWAGWKFDKTRKSYNIMPGKWLTEPCNIENIVRKSGTPASGWHPIYPEAWNNHGELKMANGKTASFLLSKRIGKGTLVVSSFDFGFAGGHVMFGHINKDQSIMLIKNLYNMHKNGN